MSGRLVAVASSVMGMDDVLLAKMTCGGQSSSSCRKRSILACLFSMIASMIRSHSSAGASSVVGLILPMIASFSASVSFPLATLPARFFPMAPIPLATNASVTSRRTTSYPAAAITCAIPEPMNPAPTTMILLISMPSASLMYFVQYRHPGEYPDRHPGEPDPVLLLVSAPVFIG